MDEFDDSSNIGRNVETEANIDKSGAKSLLKNVPIVEITDARKLRKFNLIQLFVVNMRCVRI